MKTFKNLFKGMLFAIVFVGITACSDDDDVNDNIIINFDESAGITFTNDGCWDKVYDTSVYDFKLDGVLFSHYASEYKLDGYTYSSWYGFCPSKSVDNNDYGNGDWTLHQWGAITGGGLAGVGDSYLLGFWNSSEDINQLPLTPACCITYEGGTFDPEEVYVTNSAWGYYAMKNGSSFNKQFTDGDWCVLHIYGVRAGLISGKVDVFLAQDANILNTWQRVDLDPLGEEVDMIYFQITSSDTGAWGMNNPAFFCLDNLEIDVN
jgi:hypothetical protein